MVRELSPDRKRAALAALSDDEAEALLYDWGFWARPEQLAPPGDWFVWLLRSGRGFGKTRTGAEWVIGRARAGFRRIALVGQTKADVRDTMIEVGESAIMRISPPQFRPVYEPSKRRLTWPNGAMAIVYSGDEPDQLRGPQHDTAWVDELAKFKYPQESWDNLMFGLRIGARPQVCVTTTPRPIPLIKTLREKPTTVDVQRPTWDNRDNLSAIFLREVIGPYQGTRLGRQEIDGEILDDNPRALWRRGDIEAARVLQHPDLQRVVVAVDPSATAGGDAAGIVVAGVARDPVSKLLHFYVLEDCTLQGSPLTWARAAIAAYHRHRADRMVAEVNNGGEMVETTIRSVEEQVAREGASFDYAPSGRSAQDAARSGGRGRVAYRTVHATRGKAVRAEPVAAVYEQGRGHHVGMFAQLEDEMCQWEPGDASPNRMDALVWAATELVLGEIGGAYQY